MNYQLLSRFLGILLTFVGVSMALAAGYGLYFHEGEATEALLLSLAITVGLGVALYLAGRSTRGVLSRREGIAVVGLGWTLAAIFGSLPFVLSGVIPNPVDAFFETMSGFTTTGATVIVAVEEVPKAILFWRSFTHWLGGMGIIVLLVGVLPALGVGGKRLFRSEVPGPEPDVLGSRIRQTATLLWIIYLVISLLEVALLWLQKMSLFDALCHTFGTVATGGFSTHTRSIAEFHSLGIEVTIIAFMFLSGANFALYSGLVTRRGVLPWRNGEWRAYSLILLVSTLVVAFDLVRAGNGSAGRSLREAAFQVTSIMTTTGFTSADFDLWPSLSKVILVVLMFVGGCAGSTGGSMKVVRLVVVAKFAGNEAKRVFRPQLMRRIRVGETVVSPDMANGIMAYFALFMGVFVVTTLLLAGMKLDAATAISASVACLGNVGPGLAAVGATQNYAVVPAAGKLLLAFAMLVGRLEIFTIIALLLPSFWRR